MVPRDSANIRNVTAASDRSIARSKVESSLAASAGSQIHLDLGSTIGSVAALSTAFSRDATTPRTVSFDSNFRKLARSIGAQAMRFPRRQSPRRIVRPLYRLAGAVTCADAVFFSSPPPYFPISRLVSPRDRSQSAAGQLRARSHGKYLWSIDAVRRCSMTMILGRTDNCPSGNNLFSRFGVSLLLCSNLLVRSRGSEKGRGKTRGRRRDWIVRGSNRCTSGSLSFLLDQR